MVVRPASTCGTYKFKDMMRQLEVENMAKVALPGMLGIKLNFLHCGAWKFMYDHVRYHERATKLMEAQKGWRRREPSPCW